MILLFLFCHDPSMLLEMETNSSSLQQMLMTPIWEKTKQCKCMIYRNFKGFLQKRVVHCLRWCHIYYITLVFNAKKWILEPRKAAGVPLDDLVLTHLLEACRLGSSHKKNHPFQREAGCHCGTVIYEVWKENTEFVFFDWKARISFMKGWWYDRIWCSCLFAGGSSDSLEADQKNILVIWLFLFAMHQVTYHQLVPSSSHHETWGRLAIVTFPKNTKNYFNMWYFIQRLIYAWLVIHVGGFAFVSEILDWYTWLPAILKHPLTKDWLSKIPLQLADSTHHWSTWLL